MEEFTLTDLKNIARKEKLSGWSKFNKQDLMDFLLASDIDVEKHKPEKCTKKTKISVVKQALDEEIAVVDESLNIKSKKKICKEFDKKTDKQKKEDIIKQALDLNIVITKPNGKPKTVKELYDDISVILLEQQQLVAPLPNDEPGEYRKQCIKRAKKDIISEALSLNIDILQPNGKVKTVKELCAAIEMYNAIIQESTNNETMLNSFSGQNVYNDDQIDDNMQRLETLRLQNQGPVCIVNNEQGLPNTDATCIMTNDGTQVCTDNQKTCIVADVCSANTDDVEVCVPTTVCAENTSEIQPVLDAAKYNSVAFDQQIREVDMTNIESALKEINDPASDFANLVSVKRTIFASLGLIQ